MNDESRQSRRCRLRRLAAVLAAAIALLTAACSGGSPAGSSGRAPATSSSGSPSPGHGRSAAVVRPVSEQKQLAYSKCMRSHGVPGVPTSFPSPVPGKPPRKGNFKAVQANGPGPGSPQWQAAQQACQSLMPTPVEVPG
jgi:hypothetical protein